jgi:uncharacterized protein (UPF0297 family)
MAKVKGPLLSMDASGKIADSLVFMSWKGIKDVRQHVIPANPQTAAQQEQRSFMTEAVDVFHETAYNALDMQAWDVLASTLGRAMSGFNAYVKRYIDAKVSGKTFTPIYGCTVTGVSESGFTVKVRSDLSSGVKLYIGTGKTMLGTEVSGTYNAGTKEWTFEVAGLSSGVTYYFQVASAVEGEEGQTGIYSQKTA